MKAIEACQKRIPRVRLKIWANPNAYLRLPLMAAPDGKKFYGPWAELYDDYTQEEVLGIRPGSQRIPLPTLMNEKDFEPYTGTISPHEQDPENFARGYAEN